MKVSKIDMTSDNFRRELYDSLANTGFAVLTNHGIEKHRLDDVYNQWAKFFASEDKHRYKAEHGGASGYFPMKSENAKGYSVKDLKEFYHLFGESFDTNTPNGITESTSFLAKELERLGKILLVDINYEYRVREGKDLDLLQMVRWSSNTLFRILHYPPSSLRCRRGCCTGGSSRGYQSNHHFACSNCAWASG